MRAPRIKVRAVAARIVRHPANRFAPHAEHLGFVAYSAAEVYALHWLAWFIAAYLLATGIWVMFARNI